LPSRSAPLATALLELLNHAIGIGVAGAKASCKPVPTAPRDSLAIGEDFKVTGLAGRNDGFNAKPFLIRATRLATLDLLFCHVGQECISIFILFSNSRV
jgi:hypothetical protein